MKHTMKLLSMILSICMVLGMLPLSAFATEELCYTVTIDGITTNYTDINEAFDTANAAQSATVTLHQDVNESISDLTVYGGNVTLDLNGRTSKYSISVTSGILTVKDSATNKGTVLNRNGSAVTYYGGKLIIEDSVDAYSEADGHEPWIISIAAAPDGTVTAGSTGKEEVVLPEGVIVTDWDGNEYTQLPVGGFLMFHRHTWSTSACTELKVCDFCGKIADDALGHSVGSDGVCTVCGKDPSKLITIIMSDSYGDGWDGNAIRIIENGQRLGLATVESGDQASWTGDYDSSKLYAFKWQKGNYPEECVFTVLIGGEVVYSAGTGDCKAFTEDQELYSQCDHNFDNGTVTPPTCTEDGYTTYACCICSDVFIGDVMPKTGHSIGSDGTCSVCGYDSNKKIIINMVDRYGDGWNNNAIRVFENGQELCTVTLESDYQDSWSGDYDSTKSYTFKWVKGNYPEECSFELVLGGEVVFTASTEDCASFADGQQIYPTCEHVLEKGETVAATCTEDGYTVYICNLCGGIWKRDPVIMLGHSKPTEGVTEYEATCTEAGYIEYTCTTCGEPATEYVTASLGHTPDDTEPTYVEPDCVHEGYYLYTCERCGAQYMDDYVPRTGHTLGDDGNCTVCTMPYTVSVTVSGVDVTVENMDDVLGDGTVSFDAKTNTLTLNNYTYNGDDIAVYAAASLNIELVGRSTISTSQHGFCFDAKAADIQISGTGFLSMQTGAEAIRVDADFAKLTIGGGVRILFQPDNEEGIYMIGTDTELVIKDRAALGLGDMGAPLAEECIYVFGETRGKVTVTDRASLWCVTTDEEGIVVGADDSTIDISGNPELYIVAKEEGLDATYINISGGEIEAYGGNAYAGISAIELTVTGGTVYAGTSEEDQGCGIEVEKVHITGGVVHVTNGGLILYSENGLVLGEGMAIADPEGAVVGMVEGMDRYAVLNPDGTLAQTVSIEKTNAAAKFDIDAARLDLGSSLKFQFGVDRQVLKDVTGLYAVIEKIWDDGTVSTTQIPATKWQTTEDYWVISYEGLAAKEMNDYFFVTIYNAEGEAISNTREDSVSFYVNRIFDTQTDACKTVLADMLLYGTQAQLYFGYNTDALAHEALTDDQLAYSSAEQAAVESVQVKGDHYYGSRLILESRIQLQVAFEGLTSDMYAIFTYTDCNGVEQQVRVNGNQFIDAGNITCIELDRLVYADARATVTVTVYNADGTVYDTAADSIASYCQRITQCKDLCDSLMRFADSAKAYLYG